MKRAAYTVALLTLIAGAALFAAPATADAATKTIRWVQPSTLDNGQPLPTPLDHNKVYRGTKADGSDLVLIATLTPAATSYVDNGPPVGDVCYAVTASLPASVPNAAEGLRSAVVCSTVPVPPPPKVRPTKPSAVAVS